ncbi:hypothetical protein KY389_09565 [Paracoccus bogoriensis]|uniref:hypothetical protein n=1 Tax=Paracoccus bogoriensis TaxID=242065 RepID=UPI001CA59069|nr:hypothetical protein [Paracoccus bogoriensis]
MDGKDAWRDNVFVEHLWRTIKYKKTSCGPVQRVQGTRRDRARSGLPQQPPPIFIA